MNTEHDCGPPGRTQTGYSFDRRAGRRFHLGT
ncbi:Uncharacterised protein [Bordetella pertussis]|nr:Uncharacterised protein [Bordetella pertussis]